MCVRVLLCFEDTVKSRYLNLSGFFQSAGVAALDSVKQGRCVVTAPVGRAAAEWAEEVGTGARQHSSRPIP
ncbi:hypothetical protein IscW_ISCW013806 [Ixodes scapularis]|uniref:Uncharacterized protein n=1 Tax=Ixodes scapularis TaxID=6945 RepID=B7QHS8_IXOSC|nr:hypothetical protein IscW_ISCW013806 [Ixodes scapularis]|eukprot:XP_002414735.1 hypothetical protein IscW_ISCW013806 [Ixodes scapularis]